MTKKRTSVTIIMILALVILLVGNLLAIVWKPDEKVSQDQGATETKSVLALPKVNTEDWELVLINRDHLKPEMNPEIVSVETIEVDSRIAQATQDFLAAARDLDATFHLISGYRSVVTQDALYNGYLAQEMAENPSLTLQQAEEKVQTYSQPAGASEHQTGLAIDISTVDALNQADAQIMEKLGQLAPTYGFVRRFEADKTASTGIGYEDWHFRYVGKASATYMAKNKLSLEEYLKLLEENN